MDDIVERYTGSAKSIEVAFNRVLLNHKMDMNHGAILIQASQIIAR